MAALTTAASPSERTYAAFVVRHRVLLATGVLIGIAVAALVLLWRPESYVAAARVTLTAYAVAPGMDTDRPIWISPDSDAQVLSSLPVLTAAAQRTDFPGGADALASRMAVSAVPNSRILVVRIRDIDPDRAIATASAVVEEFLALRGESALIRAETARSTLGLQIRSVSEQLASFRATVLAGGLLDERARAREQQLTDRLDDLQADVAHVASRPSSRHS